VRHDSGLGFFASRATEFCLGVLWDLCDGILRDSCCGCLVIPASGFCMVCASGFFLICALESVGIREVQIDLDYPEQRERAESW
jgi:hypothetical protein